MPVYNKPPKTYDDHVNDLLSQGLKADRTTLLGCLKIVNYYRLKGYFFKYRNPDKTFKTGTDFKRIWCFYRFDRQLRFRIIDAIERVEVCVRTKLIYHFVHIHGSFGYLEKNNLPNISQEKFDYLQKDLKSEYQRSKELFVANFKTKYGDAHTMPPLWMMGEIMSFGKVLTFFNGVEDDIKKKVAAEFGIPDRLLQSWLLTLNYIRNICAHHGRLWDKDLSVKPLLPPENKFPEWHTPYTLRNDRIYIVLCILRFLLRTAAPKSGWPLRLLKLLRKYRMIPFGRMGFPVGWKRSSFWVRRNIVIRVWNYFIETWERRKKVF